MGFFNIAWHSTRFLFVIRVFNNIISTALLYTLEWTERTIMYGGLEWIGNEAVMNSKFTALNYKSN
jgi:hypothetical protein